VLAGYDGSTAEDMPGHEPAPAAPGKPPSGTQPTIDQSQTLRDLLENLAELDPNVDWKARAREAAGAQSWNNVTSPIADRVIEKLRGELEKLVGEPE
jgi:hypothetical protein